MSISKNEKEKKLYLLEVERIHNLELLQEKLGMKASTILNRLFNSSNNNELFNRIISTIELINDNQKSEIETQNTCISSSVNEIK